MKQYDVITIGSTLIDVFVQSNEFSLQSNEQGVVLCSNYGEKIEVDTFALLTGGGAGNTAVGFQRQGFTTAVIAETGTDVMGAMIKQEFESEGVATELLVQERREETGMSVVLVAPEGGRTILVHRGAATMLEAEDVPLEHIQTGWVHLSNISGVIPLLEKIGRYCSNNAVSWSWNPGKSDIEKVIQQLTLLDIIQPTIMILNKEEWELFQPAHATFARLSTVIVVTNGRNGGAVLTGGEERFSFTLDTTVKPVDETGAGDAFSVGFVSAYVRDQASSQDMMAKIKFCCEAGKKSAASVVQHLGAKAGLPRA